MDPYPKKPVKPMVPGKGAIPDAFRNYADELELYEKELKRFREAQAEWNRKQGELEDKFKADALEEVGLSGHPKAGKAWSKAWEHGHSSGYPEVFCWLEELAELLRDDA